ncbi:hypothetical protein GALMADRAFT_1133402 [Galerina marginata CBS 339.88]|uniref:Uncharacterized protein n=1 Tax=Galerina marginata (strain CBS 339.88) TaxID=685588 RepID=A0A067SJW2_GALM3|nr:hypothetical protein GALMADRAFT_1133402 [Galerina marginata CBS 339.88]
MPMLITPSMSLGFRCRLPELYVSLWHLQPSSRRSTNIGRRFFSDRLVVTLRPEKMEAVNQDVADIAGRKKPIFRCMPHKGIIGMAIPTTTAESPVGVLYYYDQCDLSGGLRFRLCHSVANFGDGRDLEVDVGEPWHVPLYSLIRTKHWQPIRALLLNERLVDQGLVSDIMRLPSLRRAMCSRILHTIGQPFLMDLQQKTTTFVLMNRKHMYSFALQGLLHDRASKCQPYEGSLSPITFQTRANFLHRTSFSQVRKAKSRR